MNTVNERLLTEIEPERPAQYRYGYTQPDSRLIDLPELLRIFRRRMGLLIGVTLLLMLIATLVVFQLTPRYTASTKVIIDPRQQQVVDIEAVISGLAGDAQTIESEIAVIQSRGLIDKVVEKLRLDRFEELNPTLAAQLAGQREKFFDWKRLVPEAWVETLQGKDPDAELAGDPIERERVLVIDSIFDKLDIRPIGRSRVISVSFTSVDPELAALVANTLSDLYIVEQLEAKFEATRRATEWLNERLGELRARVEASEQAVEVFRGQSGLIEGRDSSIVAQQITELNSQLIIARTEYQGVRARLEKIEELFRQGGYRTILDVLGSDVIDRLRREEETELRRREAELSSQYGPKHPVMVNIRAEIELLERQLESEAAGMMEDIRSEVAVLLERVRAFETSLDELKVEAAKMNSTEIRLRQLEREATANRALFETFLNRFKETEQSGLEQPDARIISLANVPAEPSFPNKKLILSVALLGSLAVAVGLIFAAEVLETGFMSAEEIEREMHVPGIGIIPRVRGLGVTPQNYVIDKPMSALAESMRSLLTALLLRLPQGSDSAAVLFTSSIPGEGKSSVVASMARVVARSGRKVAIVDCDIRRPQTHKMFGLSLGPGVTDFIRQDPDLDSLIQSDPVSGAAVVTAGAPVQDPQELLRSDRMRYLISRLKERYDIVLIDSPPVLPVSDPKVLTDLSDLCVLCVKYRTTRRSAARTALQQMIDARAEVAGVVLSQVDVRRHAKYGYGDSGYYYGKYKKYYTG